MLVNIHDAKARFSKLINQVLKGKEIVITRDGKPLIRLVPYTKEPETRKGGQLKGLIQFSRNFDAPLPNNILNQFYGDEE